MTEETERVIVGRLSTGSDGGTDKKDILTIADRYTKPGQQYSPDHAEQWLFSKLLITTNQSRYFGRPAMLGGRRHIHEHLGVFIDLDSFVKNESANPPTYLRTPKSIGTLVIGETFYWGRDASREKIELVLSASARDIEVVLPGENPLGLHYDPSFDEVNQELRFVKIANSAWELATRCMRQVISPME